MAFSTDLQIELITTGEKAGLWGTITNNNLQILELASSGYFSTAALATGNLTLQLDNGSAAGTTTASGKNLMIEVTGTLTANRVITMPTGAERIFIVKDSTVRSSSNFTIGVQNVGATTGIVPLTSGASTIYYTDGTTADSMKLLGVLNKSLYNVVGGTNSPYTAIAGDTLFVSTSAQAAEVILPTTPSQGDQITIMDGSVTGGFATNNCVINRNGQPINNDNTQNVTLSTNSQSLTLIYTNTTRGWIYKSTNQ
tara:strand:+ start:165 stop:926 length:762 start_codon:yes stop_codon:yes gene_type:complete